MVKIEVLKLNGFENKNFITLEFRKYKVVNKY